MRLTFKTETFTFEQVFTDMAQLLQKLGWLKSNFTGQYSIERTV